MKVGHGFVQPFVFSTFEVKNQKIMDAKNQSIINSLHPCIRQSAIDAITECNLVLSGRAKVRLTYGQRTIDEQNGLYALGRTKVNPDGKSKSKPLGNIVTNAKGFQSLHSPYGLAVDFVLLVDGKTFKWDDIGDYDGDGVADWMEVVRVFEKHGWEAGIRWKSFRDAPHFQKASGYTWQQLKVMYEAGKFIEGTKYIDLTRVPITDSAKFRTTASVNLRSGAGTNYRVLQTVLKGETVLELSRSNGWSKVTYNGLTGFMSNQYLTK